MVLCVLHVLKMMLQARKMQDDFTQKEQAWQNEKSALINAMQAMKELLMHANSEV